MFYVYNTEIRKVEKVDKINKVIHRHRNTKEKFTFDEEIVQSEVVQKAVRPKK